MSVLFQSVSSKCPWTVTNIWNWSTRILRNREPNTSDKARMTKWTESIVVTLHYPEFVELLHFHPFIRYNLSSSHTRYIWIPFRFSTRKNKWKGHSMLGLMLGYFKNQYWLWKTVKSWEGVSLSLMKTTSTFQELTDIVFLKFLGYRSDISRRWFAVIVIGGICYLSSVNFWTCSVILDTCLRILWVTLDV